MYYYIYQITNLVNNKIYVGVHKTSHLDDGYMGSGKVIRHAIEKHGLENFRKDILEFFQNAKDMYAREKEIVTEEFLLREDVYNLRRGGHGGFDYINSQEELRREKNLRARTITNRIIASRAGKANQKKNGINQKWLKAGRTSFLGKKHSDDSKEKMRQTHKANKHQQGENNAHFGKIWIYNEKTFESIRIPKNQAIPNGWIKGRKIKKQPFEQA